MGFILFFFKYSFVLENGFDPKKPLWAENGEGWLLAIIKLDFETKALELCSTEGSYNVLEKKIEILEIDETPAYGLETKLKIGISGTIECKKN